MDVAYRNQAPVSVLGIAPALDGVAPDVLKEDCGGGSTAKEISHAQVPTFLLEFRRVDPKQPDAGSPDTGGPLALAVHNQRVTVRYAYRAGNIGMGGKGEHRHQGGSGPLQCGHGGMVHRIFVIGNGRASVIGTQYDLRYTRGQPPQGGKP